MSEGNGSPDINAVSAGFDALSQPNTQTQAEKQEGVTRREFLQKSVDTTAAAIVANSVAGGFLGNLFGRFLGKVNRQINQQEPSEQRGEATGQSMVPPQPGVTPPANPNNKR